MRTECCLCHDPLHPDRPSWNCLVSFTPDPSPSHTASMTFSTPVGNLPACVTCRPQGGLFSTIQVVPHLSSERTVSAYIDIWDEVEENTIRLLKIMPSLQAVSVAEGLSRMADDLDGLCSLARMADVGKEL